MRCERYRAVPRRWFTGGWTGDLAMAGDIFSEEVRTNGVQAGVAGPVGRIGGPPAGFSGLTRGVQDIFVAGGQRGEALIGRGPQAGAYGGGPATGRQVEVRDTAIWHFRDGRVTE